MGAGTSSEKFRITGDGRLYGTALHNNANSVTGTTNQYIASGTYTPTLTNQLNVASLTSYIAQWIRVGNVVNVSGRATISLTSNSGITEFDISLPINSNLTTNQQCSGVMGSGSTNNEQGAITSDTINKTALAFFQASSTSSRDVYYSFTYVIN